jgi:hypothetical protein
MRPEGFCRQDVQEEQAKQRTALFSSIRRLHEEEEQPKKGRKR